MLRFKWKMNELKDGVKYKKCSKCNIVFTCNDSETSCWCNNYELTREQLSFLRENYDNCLCEQCIEKISREAN